LTCSNFRFVFSGQFSKIRNEPFVEPHKRWWKKAGVDAKFLHYTLPLGVHCALVLDADIVKDILFSNYGESPRFKKRLNGLIPIVGNSLVTLEGTDWQRHRRIIHPSFQPALIRESLGNFVPKIMSKFIGYWEKADGREINVSIHMSNLTLDVIGEVAFSHDFHALDWVEQWTRQGDDEGGSQNGLPNDKVMEAMTSIFQNTPRRMLFQLFKVSFLDFSTSKSIKMLDEAVDAVIAEARRKLENNKKLGDDADSDDSSAGENVGATKPLGSRSGYGQISLVQRLLDAENSDLKKPSRKCLAMEELRDEVKTFILAGHETTSTWCHWAFFALCKNPDVQKKVLEDIEKHSSEDEKAEISVQMIERMTYFDAFMKEVLRLYPPAGMIVRYNMREEKFKGETIPPETRLTIPIHLLHRHPNYWKDPELFQPERWLGKEHPSSNRCAFLPFSKGPRNCIGYQFAELEAKLLLAPLIRRFAIRLAPSLRDTEFTFTTSITMKLKPALKIEISSREPKKVK